MSLLSGSKSSAVGRERLRSVMDSLIYLEIVSPNGQINVHGVCSLWVKSLRIASCNLIPSAESAGNGTTLSYEIEVICYICTLFPLQKRTGAVPYPFCNAEEMMGATDLAAINSSHLYDVTILCLQGLKDNIIQILNQNCSYSYAPPPLHPILRSPSSLTDCNFYMWQQHHLLAKVRHLPYNNLYVYISPGEGSHEPCMWGLHCGCGQASETIVSFNHKSIPHFIWN